MERQDQYGMGCRLSLATAVALWIADKTNYFGIYFANSIHLQFSFPKIMSSDLSSYVAYSPGYELVSQSWYNKACQARTIAFAALSRKFKDLNHVVLVIYLISNTYLDTWAYM